MTRARLFLDWAPAVLWAALLLSLGGVTMSARSTTGVLARLLPSASFDQLFILNWMMRKSAHICGYAILALLNFRAIRGGRSGWLLRWSVLAVALTLPVAIADEFHQSYSPVRSGSPADVAFDLWGAAVSQFFVKGRGR